MRRVRCWLAASLLLGACSSGPAVPSASPLDRSLERPSASDPELSPDERERAPASAQDAPEAVARMLARVGEVRQLPPKRPVDARRVSREEAITLIMKKTKEEVPEKALEGQGELLRGLGLVPLDYDFVEGLYSLIRNNIAGFYDQTSKAMFLLDDLSKSVDEETLAHELVHAMQDQHHDLALLLKYSPGQADRISAGHALAEGDATAAMVAIIHGRRASIDPDALRMALLTGVAFSEGGKTPRVLQLALISPYVDGYRFVEQLRARDGWKAVDAAYARLPASTEQLLHLDKYDAAEPPVAVSTPPLPSEDWQELDADVLGEQGLRLTLAQWSPRAEAEKAAAGWGGDHYVVGRREAEAGREYAAAWTLVFDDEAEAKEAEAILASVVGGACRERSDLGPLAYARRGATIVLVAGPWRSASATLTASGSCKGARRWVDAIFASQ